MKRFTNGNFFRAAQNEPADVVAATTLAIARLLTLWRNSAEEHPGAMKAGAGAFAAVRDTSALRARVLDQHRSTQRKVPTMPDDEAALTADVIALATAYLPLRLPTDRAFTAALRPIARNRRAVTNSWLKRLSGERQAAAKVQHGALSFDNRHAAGDSAKSTFGL